MTGESHVENLKAGTGFQNPASSNLLMAGFDLLDVTNITSGDGPVTGTDAANLTLTAGSAIGASSADGGELRLRGGDSVDLGQAGDVVIQGGTSGRTPGGAVLIRAGYTGAAATSATGGIISLSSGRGGSVDGPGGTINLTTANGNGTGNAGKMTLRAGTGGTTGAGGEGGGIELIAGAGGGTNSGGGTIDITAGNGSFAQQGIGGDVNVNTGKGTGSGSSGDFRLNTGVVEANASSGFIGLYTANAGTASGNSGYIYLATGVADNGDAGNIALNAGTSNNGGSGGTVSVTGGSGGATSNGGSFKAYAGNGGSTSGTPGKIGLYSGAALGGDTVGGDANLFAGAGAGTANGGTAEVRAGDAGPTGDGGDVVLRPGDETSGIRGLVRTFRGAFGRGVQNNGTINGSFTIEPSVTDWVQLTWGAAAIGTLSIGATRSGGTANGVVMTLEITNGGQGTLTWGAEVEWAGGTPPTLTAAGKDLLRFHSRDEGTTWMGEEIALALS